MWLCYRMHATQRLSREHAILKCEEFGGRLASGGTQLDRARLAFLLNSKLPMILAGLIIHTH